MTDKPTLSLDSAEWRAMLGHNLIRAIEFVQSSTHVTAENVTAFHLHLDRMKALATAWHLSAPKAADSAVASDQHAQAPATAQTNGAAPKRKGGWPKGKPRKRHAATQAAMQ